MLKSLVIKTKYNVFISDNITNSNYHSSKLENCISNGIING